MASKRDLSVVIDIGTSKMVAIAGEKNEQDKKQGQDFECGFDDAVCRDAGVSRICDNCSS